MELIACPKEKAEEIIRQNPRIIFLIASAGVECFKPKLNDRMNGNLKVLFELRKYASLHSSYSCIQKK